MSAEVIEDHQVALGARWFSVGAFELALYAASGRQSGGRPVIRFAPVRLVLADPASCASGWIAAASRRAVTRCWVVEMARLPGVESVGECGVAAACSAGADGLG